MTTCGTHTKYFGVSRRVTKTLRLIMRSTHYSITMHQHSSDRDFALLIG